MQFEFDRRFRKSVFSNNYFNGIKNELLGAREYVEEYIARHEEDRDLEIELWEEREERLKVKYLELNSFGYKNRAEYFFGSEEREPDIDLEVLDIVGDINRMSTTNEEKEEYFSAIDNYNAEIESARVVIELIRKIAPIAHSAKIEQVEDIDELFKEHDCELLLRLPDIIDLPKAAGSAYF